MEDEHATHRIRIDGVIIRYVEDMYSVYLTIEGNLPQPILDTLISDLGQKLSTLENTPYELKEL